MTQELDPLDFQIVGAAPGDSIELAWQASVEAGQARPGVRPPSRCQLVDAPQPPDNDGTWSDKWIAKLDFGEAVGWPTHHDGTRQWYQFIGICTPLEAG